jgi:hypothetical protein
MWTEREGSYGGVFVVGKEQGPGRVGSDNGPGNAGWLGCGVPGGRFRLRSGAVCGDCSSSRGERRARTDVNVGTEGELAKETPAPGGDVVI